MVKRGRQYFIKTAANKVKNKTITKDKNKDKDKIKENKIVDIESTTDNIQNALINNNDINEENINNDEEDNDENDDENNDQYNDQEDDQVKENNKNASIKVIKITKSLDQVENKVINKKPVISKQCINLAIEILCKIDPKKKLTKQEVIENLKEYLQEINDLAYIEAIEYLLDSFENLEEKLTELSQNRLVQANKLKGVRLKDDVFVSKINLDSDEREPDENDRIFLLGKKIFSGTNSTYKKPVDKESKKFKELIQPKRDTKKLKAFNI